MIRVLVPHMPEPEAVLHYLRGMHERGVYVNNGPLVQELEAELSGLFTDLPTQVVCNGTAAIELLLLACGIRPGDRVLVPAMTFRATALAVVQVGAIPVLGDVDPVTWQLTPGVARSVCDLRRIRAVIPVASFGAPVPVSAWDDFAQDRRIPVIVDAAAAITEQRTTASGRLHFAYSLHATKFIGAGEGGAIASGSRLVVQQCRELANFGLDGTNRRMSEYHAAVALASIEMMGAKRRAVAEVTRAYRDRLRIDAAHQQPGAVDRTVFPILIPGDLPASRVAERMAERGVETRQWYRPFPGEGALIPGTYQVPFATPTTNALSSRMLGLPFHHRLTAEDVTAVCQTLNEALL